MEDLEESMPEPTYHPQVQSAEQEVWEQQAVTDAIALAEEAWQRRRDQEQADLVAWNAAVPDPYANSHGFDEVPKETHAISVTSHDQFHVVPMHIPRYRAAIEAYEAGPKIAPAAVKVV